MVDIKKRDAWTELQAFDSMLERGAPLLMAINIGLYDYLVVDDKSNQRIRYSFPKNIDVIVDKHTYAVESFNAPLYYYASVYVRFLKKHEKQIFDVLKQYNPIIETHPIVNEDDNYSVYKIETD